jgi:toxin ParE1/3/4
MTNPVITEPARQDLDEMWDWLAGRNEPAADRLLDAILQRAQLHASQPLMGRPRDDLRPGLRSFVVRPYVVFYRPVEGTIEVLRVLHGSRDTESIMREEGDG